MDSQDRAVFEDVEFLTIYAFGELLQKPWLALNAIVIIMKEPKYKSQKPKWSIKTSFWSALFISSLVSAIVLIVSKKSIWIELELIVAIISIFIFIFLFYVLFHGVRFDSDEKFSITWSDAGFENLGDYSPGIGLHTGLTEAGAETGPLGIVVGFLLDIDRNGYAVSAKFIRTQSVVACN